MGGGREVGLLEVSGWRRGRGWALTGWSSGRGAGWGGPCGEGGGPAAGAGEAVRPRARARRCAGRFKSFAARTAARALRATLFCRLRGGRLRLLRDSGPSSTPALSSRPAGGGCHGPLLAPGPLAPDHRPPGRAEGCPGPLRGAGERAQGPRRDSALVRGERGESSGAVRRHWVVRGADAGVKAEGAERLPDARRRWGRAGGRGGRSAVSRPRAERGDLVQRRSCRESQPRPRVPLAGPLLWPRTRLCGGGCLTGW